MTVLNKSMLGKLIKTWEISCSHQVLYPTNCTQCTWSYYFQSHNT